MAHTTYRVHIDETLEDIRKSTSSDSIGAWDFFQIIQDKIFTPLADAHTSIEKPACFSGAVYQPFSLSGKMGTIFIVILKMVDCMLQEDHLEVFESSWLL